MSEKEKDNQSYGGLIALVALLFLAFASVQGGAEGQDRKPNGNGGGNNPAERAGTPAAKCKGSDRACLLRYKRNGRLVFSSEYGCQPANDFRAYRTIDSRVWAYIKAVADRQGGVLVGCLKSGHDKYVDNSYPLRVSAHWYGDAVDIMAVKMKAGGPFVYITPSMQSGSGRGLMVSLIRLGESMNARQCISLLELGGCSFDMSNHGGHIHIGY